MKDYKKYLLKISILRCGILASTIGAIINMTLFKEGRMVWYLGVEVFFTAFFTALVCCAIYANIYKKEDACRKAPRMPYDLQSHFLFKHFPKNTFLQCVFMGAVCAVVFASVPALVLIVVGQHTVCSKALWVLSKWATAMFYVPFSVYYMSAYKITEKQMLYPETAERC